MKTMFKLVAADGGTICTARFEHFSDDPDVGRAAAEKHIRHQKERWEAQPMFAGEILRVVEE